MYAIHLTNFFLRFFFVCEDLSGFQIGDEYSINSMCQFVVVANKILNIECISPRYSIHFFLFWLGEKNLAYLEDLW